MRTKSLLVFSKHDCALCEELKERLRRWHIAFEECDIRQREDWFERYRERVPVVKLESGEEHDPPFSESLLRSWAAQTS